MGWVGWQPRVENCARKTGNNTKILARKRMYSKLSAVVALANFQQKE
jgi:hypothetical protein